MESLIGASAPAEEVTRAAREIQDRLNPHPAGQLQLNVPRSGGEPMPGMQHKYRETALFFPSQGQTCHTYCTYCFRWAQFVGIEDLRFASREAEVLEDYVRQHPDLKSVLFTGGDPLVMKTALLRRYIEPLLEIDHLQSIRIGTKALAWWPYRFVTDDDADDLLRLFEEIRDSGRNIALMSHYSHPRELGTDVARAALRRVLGAGATVRCQAPLIRHVNDDPDTWAQMWNTQVRLGAIPYYMFIERNTGPRNYFELPLASAYGIFSKAYRSVSGLGRTVRGPSMSARPGKVLVDGIARINGQRVFVLKFLQGRNPEWANRVFFAKYDPAASWLSELEPAFAEGAFFYESEMRRIEEHAATQFIT
jgi:KamA family protein